MSERVIAEDRVERTAEEIAADHRANRCANVTTRHPNGRARSCLCTEEIRAAKLRAPRVVAEDRAETEPCQRGTDGCCIDHGQDVVDSCQTW